METHIKTSDTPHKNVLHHFIDTLFNIHYIQVKYDYNTNTTYCTPNHIVIILDMAASEKIQCAESFALEKPWRFSTPNLFVCGQC